MAFKRSGVRFSYAPQKVAENQRLFSFCDGFFCDILAVIRECHGICNSRAKFDIWQEQDSTSTISHATRVSYSARRPIRVTIGGGIPLQDMMPKPENQSLSSLNSSSAIRR